MYEVPPGAMWTAGVDYYRATYRSKRDEGLESRIIREMERIGGERIQGLYRWEPWKWMGYDGFRLGTMSYGYGGSGAYLYQASGVAANEVFDVHLPFTKVPRLDVQVTIWYEKRREDIAQACASASNAARYGRRGRPWGVRYISGFGNGDTTYVGTRGKKTKFLRIYDKEREAVGEESYLGAWRFECESTDDYAREAAHTLYDLGCSAQAVAAVVQGLFRERGISLDNACRQEPIAAARLPKDEGSTERRLRWLGTQVRQAIDKLIADGVDLSLISDALGLSGRQVEVE